MKAGMLAALAALALGGCVVSEQPLFNPLSALTPAQPGRYEQQEMRERNWVMVRAGTLTLSGRTYRWQVDDEKEPTPQFTVHEASSEYFTLYSVLTDRGKTKHYYALIKPTPEGYLFFQPLCSDFRKLDLRVGLRPQKIVESDCYYEDDAALSAALIAHAKVMAPEFRYVRVGDLAAAPRPTQGAPRPLAPEPFPFIGSPDVKPGAQSRDPRP
jgi:hypothetical protein